MTEPSMDELLFFAEKPDALPLYLCLREKILSHCGEVGIQVKKTQISFVNRHLFAAVSFLPVRKAKERPKPYLTVTLGFGAKVDSLRIDVAAEVYPNRWTHHMIIGREEEIDEELIGWLQDAAAFSLTK